MDITGRKLYKTLRELRPDLSTSITPELLNKVCEEPTIQPFLQWFCSNVTHANVLLNEELQIKAELEKRNEWLEGEELEEALREATKDHPELLALPSFDDMKADDLFAELEIIEGALKEDENYLETLKNSLQNLRELDDKLEEEIESEELELEKEKIEAEKTYYKCSVTLKEFDKGNREFSENVESLLKIYADAAENKGPPILWTQIPLELFVKQMELYNEYLEIYIKQQFGNINSNNNNSNSDEYEIDSDYVSLINDSKEKGKEEKIQELEVCKINLTDSKIEEITAKIQEECCFGMLEYVDNVFNNGNLKVPNQSELRSEIQDLTRKKLFLEENVSIQNRQLTEVVQQFAELETIKILNKQAEKQLQRRRAQSEKLKNLRTLTREEGHVHADLLCILLEIQFRSLEEIMEFIEGARFYLDAEYSLSLARYESMQYYQNEYIALQFPEKIYNSFERHFISMICENENCNLNTAIERYNEIISTNNEKKQNTLETNLYNKINLLERLEKEFNVSYDKEISYGPTEKLSAISYEIQIGHKEASDNLQEVQSNVITIRNKLKEQMRADFGFEREKEILWQRFLVDPETLKQIYEDAKQKADKSHFGKPSFFNER